MRIPTPRTEEAAQKASLRELLAAGWHYGRITESVEKLSKRGAEMIENTVVVPDAEGNERTLRDWLMGDSSLGALKLRHAAEAVGALAKYEAGVIGQDDFPGHDVRVKVSIEKRRGYPDQNRIEDYAAATAGRVVNLRAGGS
jgi:hypothetical protein